MNATAEEVLASVEALAKMADELKAIVHEFKI